MLTFSELVALLELAAQGNAGGNLPDFYLLAAIGLRESVGVPFAHNLNADGTIDRGLWQINSRHQQEFPQFGPFLQACYNPLSNAKMAILIWRKQGYAAWSTYNELK